MTSGDAPKPPSTRLRAIFAALFFVLLVPGAALAVVNDVFVAGADGTNGVPFVRFIQICFAIGLTFPALVVVGLDKRRWMKATYFAVAGVVLLLVIVPWHPRKRFVSDLNSVTPGMTIDQVESVMGGYMKGVGKKWIVPDGPAPSEHPPADERPQVTGTMTYRWSDDGNYDSDWAQVTFENGRVVSVEFLPD